MMMMVNGSLTGWGGIVGRGIGIPWSTMLPGTEGRLDGWMDAVWTWTAAGAASAAAVSDQAWITATTLGRSEALPSVHRHRRRVFGL